MPDRDSRPYFLLSCFAEFYEAVAGIKVAAREGRLPLLLRVGDQPVPTESADIAAMIGARLAAILQRQLSRISRESTPATVRAHQAACYAMAALADEIFVLELDWAGRNAWLDVLLEYRLFKSRIAGRQVFTLIQQLLNLNAHDVLHIDLASVLLVALQLGFKGKYRGAHGTAILRELRTRLFALLRNSDAGDRIKLAFPQAYQNLDSNTAPARLAPMTPWYIAGGIVLVVYLIVSTAVWLSLTQPFLGAIAGN